MLDTNVLSEARKPRGDEGVKAWVASVAADEIFISAIVIGGIRRGVERTGARLLNPFGPLVDEFHE
ncbi:MAG: hypothetical protein ACR2N0_04340 [Rubrobacteraceae bacterium]